MRIEDSFFEEIPMDTASAFIAKLRPTNSHWLTGKNWTSNWIFRGQNDADWSLIPSAWRLAKPGKPKSEAEKLVEVVKGILRPELKQRIDTAIDTVWKNRGREINKYTQIEYERLFDILLQAFVEYYIVAQFSEFSDELGYQIDLESFSGSTPTAFFSTYLSTLYPKIKSRNQNLWGRSPFAIAQHHGVPTRLLDWTYSPLVAAYFAAEGIVNDTNIKRIAVYALPNFYLRNEHLQTVDIPKSTNAYLRSQNGTFFFDKEGDKYYLKTGEWLDLENSLKLYGDVETPTMSPLKITLPASEVGELMRLLWVEKVTRAHLMPTIDNITIALKSKWQWSDLPPKTVGDITNRKQP